MNANNSADLNAEDLYKIAMDFRRAKTEKELAEAQVVVASVLRTCKESADKGELSCEFVGSMPDKAKAILTGTGTLGSGDVGKNLRVEIKKVEHAKIPTHVISWAHLGVNG